MQDIQFLVFLTSHKFGYNFTDLNRKDQQKNYQNKWATICIVDTWLQQRRIRSYKNYKQKQGLQQVLNSCLQSQSRLARATVFSYVLPLRCKDTVPKIGKNIRSWEYINRSHKYECRSRTRDWASQFDFWEYINWIFFAVWVQRQITSSGQ